MELAFSLELELAIGVSLLETVAVLVVGAALTVCFDEEALDGDGALDGVSGGACESALYSGGAVWVMLEVEVVVVVVGAGGTVLDEDELLDGDGAAVFLGVGVKVRKLIGEEEELLVLLLADEGL